MAHPEVGSHEILKPIPITCLHVIQPTRAHRGSNRPASSSFFRWIGPFSRYCVRSTKHRGQIHRTGLRESEIVRHSDSVNTAQVLAATLPVSSAINASLKMTQLARLQVDAESCGSQLAWCRAGNLLAAPVLEDQASKLFISLLDPDSQQVCFEIGMFHDLAISSTTLSSEVQLLAP